MTTYIENNLENMRSKFLLMGQLATDSLQLAMESLLEGDIQKAKIVRKKDEEIEKKKVDNNYTMISDTGLEENIREEIEENIKNFHQSA